ncbi:MAG TPA: outer membrane protein assembly factor BamA [bacterium]|nr:outer membrane protein assembly factor BamA [bacterium]
MLAGTGLAAAEKIVEVLVEGTVHVDKKEVLEVIQTRPGDELTSSATAMRIRDDFRAIYALGYFEDVTVSEEPAAGGRNLIFEVVEKPLVADLRYEGNQRYKAKKLNEEIGYTPKQRLFYDETLAEKLKTKILAFYTEKSFPNTEITWRTEPAKEPSTVYLIFQVKEGERLPVKEIVFEGNTVISTKALRKRIQTKESFWFLVKHQYDEAMAERDLALIELAYRDIGYLDAKATQGPVETVDGGLRVTFRVEEGKPYTVGNITLEGNTIFSQEELRKKISFQPGALFSYSALQMDRLAMVNLYREQGYLDTTIPFQLNPDKENLVVDIHFQVNESTRKYLGKVEIQGVVTLADGTVIPTEEGEFRTKDFVIRREIELKEGDPLDWTQVIESDRNLVNLDYFKTKGLPQPGQTNLVPGFIRQPLISDPNIENLLLQLEEKQTGALTFGGGVSTAFGPSVFATLSERNLFGYGVRGSITGELGEYRNRAVLNLYEPHLFNSDYSGDLDVYYIDQDGYGGRRFDEQRIGSGLTIGKKLDKELTLLLGLRGEQTDISPDVGKHVVLDETTLPEVFQLGENTTTSVSMGYIYDTRDFRLDPTTGIYNRSTLEVAGLTDNEFIKWRNLVNYFMPVYDRLVLALSGQMDLAHAYGDPGFLPLQERFFVGGSNSIRGFDEGGIGEYADIRYLSPVGGFRTYLGGEADFVGNIELRYPITEIFQAVTFLDMGANWPEIGDMDLSDFRFSTGAGLRVRIPGLNALLRVDFAVPLRYFDEDDTQYFHFSFGQSF